MQGWHHARFLFVLAWACTNSSELDDATVNIEIIASNLLGQASSFGPSP